MDLLLGHGAYANVYLKINQAYKEFRKSDRIDYDICMNVFTKEITACYILQDLKHVIKINDIQATSDIGYSMPLYPRTLHDVIHSKEYREKNRHQIIQSLVSTLAIAQHRKIIHRDIKPTNILVDEDNNIAIADWGLCKFIYSNNYVSQSVQSLWHKAPEIIIFKYEEDEIEETKIDVWSVGIIWLELICGRLFTTKYKQTHLIELFSYLGEPEMHLSIHRYYKYFEPRIDKSKKLDIETMPITDIEKSVLKRMLEFDPFKRISFIEILEQAYLGKWEEPIKQSIAQIPICCENVIDNLSKRELYKELIDVFHWLDIAFIYNLLICIDICFSKEKLSKVDKYITIVACGYLHERFFYGDIIRDEKYYLGQLQDILEKTKVYKIIDITYEFKKKINTILVHLEYNIFQTYTFYNTINEMCQNKTEMNEMYMICILLKVEVNMIQCTHNEMIQHMLSIMNKMNKYQWLMQEWRTESDNIDDTINEQDQRIIDTYKSEYIQGLLNERIDSDNININTNREPKQKTNMILNDLATTPTLYRAYLNKESTM
jgi:serine/threonine protein kinase